MSVFSNDKYMQMLARKAGPTNSEGRLITEDRECPGCKYNLRGLQEGGRCPECGRRIAMVVNRYAMHQLGQAPRAYLALLGAGFLLCAFGTLGLYPLFWTTGSSGGVAGFAFNCVLLVLWSVGLAPMMVPRPLPRSKDEGIGPNREWFRLRWFIAATQLNWFTVAFIELLIGQMTGGVVNVLEGFAFLLVAFSLYGLVAVCALASNYTDWASDSGLTHRLTGIGWVLFVTASLRLIFMLIEVTGTGFGQFASFLLLFVKMGWAAAVLTLMLTFFQMTLMVRWAVVNAENARQRDLRMTERAMRAREEAQRSPHPAAYDQIVDPDQFLSPADEPTAPEPEDPAGPRAATSERIVQKAEESPYDLEDD